jgi:hypothetical protein
MIKKIFIWLFISSVMVSVLVTNYRVTMLEEKMKGVYQSLANFQAERMAARRALQKETGSAIDKLQDLSKDYGKPPQWKEHYP